MMGNSVHVEDQRASVLLSPETAPSGHESGDCLQQEGHDAAGPLVTGLWIIYRMRI